jgi:2-oxoglutarate dehydrogenase complex dehydrogenase (E1) component-like enzyme
MKLQYQLSNRNWMNCSRDDSDRTEEFLALCTEHNRISAEGKINDRTTWSNDRTLTREEAISALEKGLTLRNDSEDWYSNCRDGEVVEAKSAAAKARQAAAAAADKRPLLRCKRCGNTGRSGDYPFSTLPGSGCCDDCL